MTNPTGDPPEQAPTTPIVSWEAPADAAGPAPGVTFAGFGPRLLAYIIDAIIVGIVATVIALIAVVPIVADRGSGATTGAAGVAASSVIFLLLFVFTLGYFPFFWLRNGQTPGMKPFNLYVVRDRDGGKISGGQAVLRVIGMWVSSIPLYLGYIWIFIDSRRRGWHDLIAGTVMIERKR
jgi:uncharacterized RDD family membrane protein YckC